MTEQIAKPAEPPAPQSGRAGGSQPRRGRSPVLESARVLVVDALPANRGAIIRFCRWAGMQHVREADSGADCTRLIEEFDPSIVIVGTRLTDTDCLALCQTIRSNPASFNLPVLVHASIESDDQWNDLIEAGVTDVLVKPINPGECVARVRLHVEKQALVQQLQKFRRRVESELNAARRMQMGLVPSKKRLAELEGKFDLRLQAHFEPSEELGGDYWDYFTLGKGRLGILNVDFSGHGIAAAINTFRLHTLIERIQPRGYRPSVWLSMINEALKPLLPIGQFATALYGIIDPVNQTFRFSSAGAPPVFVRGPDGIELCETRGVPLGIMKRAAFSEKVIDLPPDCALFLFSDAMIESRLETGELFGEERLMEAARLAPEQSPDKPMNALLRTFFDQVNLPLDDDLTAIWIDRIGAAAKAKAQADPDG